MDSSKWMHISDDCKRRHSLRLTPQCFAFTCLPTSTSLANLQHEGTCACNLINAPETYKRHVNILTRACSQPFRLHASPTQAALSYCFVSNCNRPQTPRRHKCTLLAVRVEPATLSTDLSSCSNYICMSYKCMTSIGLVAIAKCGP